MNPRVSQAVFQAQRCTDLLDFIDEPVELSEVKGRRCAGIVR